MFKKISSALVGSGFDLLGKGGSYPENNLVDLHIFVHNRETYSIMYWRYYVLAVLCTGGIHTLPS